MKPKIKRIKMSIYPSEELYKKLEAEAKENDYPISRMIVIFLERHSRGK